MLHYLKNFSQKWHKYGFCYADGSSPNGTILDCVLHPFFSYIYRISCSTVAADP